ncbi:hypothetical protein P8452_08314 [Trifolium repens]|nr:hypothetical protein P8452_08314 [Trifolium repens]
MRYEIETTYRLMHHKTYTGNILLDVNPFIRLPHLYDSHMMAQYKGAGFGELSPHSFAIADAAYSLWRFNLTRREEFMELLSEHTCWKDHVFASCRIQRGIITVSICFVLHLKRLFRSTNLETREPFII